MAPRRAAPRHHGAALALAAATAAALAALAAAAAAIDPMSLPGNAVVEPGVNYMLSQYRTQGGLDVDECSQL